MENPHRQKRLRPDEDSTPVDDSPSSAVPPPRHPFEVDPTDHSETDVRAYLDIVPVLLALAEQCGRTAATLRIWDPFYCDGGVKRRLHSLGFPSVHHEKVDFYAVTAAGEEPAFDVFITNPPYSGDHIERTIQYCVACGKPWMLLVPNWVARKEYYTAMTKQGALHAFFLSPIARYEYWMPEWLDKAAVHADNENVDTTSGRHSLAFLTSWFIQLPNVAAQESLFLTLDSMKKVPPVPSHQDIALLTEIYDGETVQQIIRGRNNNNKPWVVAKTAKGTKWKIQKVEQQQQQQAQKKQKHRPVTKDNKDNANKISCSSSNTHHHAGGGQATKKFDSNTRKNISTPHHHLTYVSSRPKHTSLTPKTVVTEGTATAAVTTTTTNPTPTQSGPSLQGRKNSKATPALVMATETDPKKEGPKNNNNGKMTLVAKLASLQQFVAANKKK